MNKPRHSKLQRLQYVLDHFGANHARWPARDRQLVSFIGESPEAERLWDDAQGLDQLLDYVRDDDLIEPNKAHDLQTRILADFTAHHQPVKSVVESFANRKSAGYMDVLRRAEWFVPASLAACFALGIHLGGIEFGDRILEFANSLDVFSGNGEQLADIAELVMSSGMEEDLL